MNCFNLAQYSGVISGLYLTSTNYQIREFQKSTGNILYNYVFPGITPEWPNSIFSTEGMWLSADSGGNNYWTPLAASFSPVRKVFVIARIFAGTALYYSNFIPDSDIARSQFDLVTGNCNFGGAVYVAGARTWFNSTANEYPQTPFVLKFNGIDGSLDTSFGINGRIPTGNELGMNAYPWPESIPAPPAGNSVVVYGLHSAVATQSDGKIIGVGISANSSLFTLTVARYNTNGTFDNSFGSDGNGWFHHFDNSVYLRASAVYIDPADKIYITGALMFDNTFVIRLSPNGILEAEFSGFSAEGEGIINLCEPFDGSLAILYTRYTGTDTPGVFALSADFSTVLWDYLAPTTTALRASGMVNGNGIIFNARNYSARLY